MSSFVRIRETLFDLYRDGYSLIGAIAPILSIGFTTAKALDVNVNLRDVSYAWAFAPLTVWLFVAYWRRWNEHYVSIGERQRDRDTWFQEAVFYLAKGRWPAKDERIFRKHGDTESVSEYAAAFAQNPDYGQVTKALSDLRQAASDGHITVWASPNARAVLDVSLRAANSVVYEQVDRLHWRSYEVAPEQLLFDPEQVYTSDHGNTFLGDRSVAALMVNKRQIEALGARLSRSQT